MKEEKIDTNYNKIHAKREQIKASFEGGLADLLNNSSDENGNVTNRDEMKQNRDFFSLINKNKNIEKNYNVPKNLDIWIPIFPMVIAIVFPIPTPSIVISPLS